MDQHRRHRLLLPRPLQNLQHRLRFHRLVLHLPLRHHPLHRPPAAGNQDSDNDTFSDAIEAIAGTDPASASDFPRSLITSAPAGIRIQSATASPNRTYSIEYATNPGATSWAVIATHQTGPSSARVAFTDSDPVRRAQPSGFYRIRFSN